MRRWIAWSLTACLAVGPVSPLFSQPAEDQQQGAKASSEDEKGVKLNGYAEWWQGATLVVDGQRVKAAPAIDFKGEGEAASYRAIPLGYEVQVEGRRQRDGTVLAHKLRAKPNGKAMFEGELSQSFDVMEKTFREKGRMVMLNDKGQVTEDYGRLLDSGPSVDRARRIANRLVPPYMKPQDFRVYVVENKEWNAMCAPNRSVYMFTGLLNDMDDDETAIIVAHELVHSTHEHSRKEYKKTMLIMAAALGVAATAQLATDNKKKQAIVTALAVVGAMAWKNGYGRKAEDQADRVGLRYAYQGGFDVRKGPALWRRFANKYGDTNKTVNFFLGNHSVAKDRERNLERELAFNYSNVHR